MSHVMIVARTRMNRGRVCVGGHDLDHDFRSLRLLTEEGMNLTEDAQIDLGEIWDLEYKDHADPDPPHVEDVLVQEAKRIERLPPAKAGELILEHESPWNGSPGEIFDGTVAGTHTGRVYVPDDGPLPSRSTGYWIPDADLAQTLSFGKTRFVYLGGGELNAFSWAGVAEPPDRIEAGTLVRVSLARWHDFDSAPAGYYTQISGIYLPSD
jgi:Dual OB-containing domain